MLTERKRSTRSIMNLVVNMMESVANMTVYRGITLYSLMYDAWLLFVNLK